MENKEATPSGNSVVAPSMMEKLLPKRRTKSKRGRKY